MVSANLLADNKLYCNLGTYRNGLECLDECQIQLEMCNQSKHQIRKLVNPT